MSIFVEFFLVGYLVIGALVFFSFFQKYIIELDKPRQAKIRRFIMLAVLCGPVAWIFSLVVFGITLYERHCVKGE